MIWTLDTWTNEKPKGQKLGCKRAQSQFPVQHTPRSGLPVPYRRRLHVFALLIRQPSLLGPKGAQSRQMQPKDPVTKGKPVGTWTKHMGQQHPQIKCNRLERVDGHVTPPELYLQPPLGPKWICPSEPWSKLLKYVANGSWFP